MNAMRICSVCSKPLAASAPQGLCPECLLKAALGTGADIGPDSQSQAESGKVPFVAPTPDELAKPFPELEILNFIGQGGMGAVYRARQKALDRIVALKILPPGIGGDPSFAQRFTREAKALARLNHPGIVTLYEFGRADGLFFFLMEFVDGVNLRQLLEAGRLSPREALAIVPQICDALQYAHDQGIVHRDIKPENILLDRQGRVKVADFGLAKLVGTEGEPSADGGVAAGLVVLTEAGKVMGTPQYMAPEQMGTPATVDHRADIYSLGVVFYQMLTGELPGKRIEPPSRKVQVDVRIDEIVLRALEKTPELRYQTAADFRTQIETVANDAGTAGPANRTDNSAPRLLNVGTSLVTTPEQLSTFEGQFFLYRRKSQMLLEDHQLTFARGGTTTVIPLAAIRDLSIGHYPRTMHPAGLDFISVTYDDGGQTKRLFFSPYESWFGLPSHFNQFVAEWFAAIRAAVVAATGREPGNTPAEQLGVPPGSMAIYALLLGPAVLAGTFVLAGVVMGVHGFKGDAATLSFLVRWLVILEVLAVGFLALAFGRLFGGSRKHVVTPTAAPGDAGQAAAPAAGALVRPQEANRVLRRRVIKVVLGLLAAVVGIGTLGAWMFLSGGRRLTGQAELVVVVMFFMTIFIAAMAALGSRGARAKPMERAPRLDAPQANQPPADWRTWSPFQPPQVREICAHMTEAERREGALRGMLFGIWNAATFFLPWAIVLFAPKPLNWIFAPIVLLVGLAFYPLWQRITREFLASTIWARQQGIAPESIPMSPQIILVGRRGGRVVIHWPGVLLCFVLILAIAQAGAIFASTLLFGRIDGRFVGIAFLSAGIFAAILVRRSLSRNVG